MFNLRKKAKQVVHEVSKSFEPKKDPLEVIAEIHNEFDSATEKLLQEAKEILTTPVNIEKGKRLYELGFTASKEANNAIVKLHEIETNSTLAKHIEHYSQKYPNNKFITEEKVKEICAKYGLVFGDVEHFKGFVPEKNLLEIENFHLMEEDYNLVRVYESVDKKGNRYKYIYSISQFSRIRWKEERVDTEEEFVGRKRPFMICASVSDFDLRNMKVSDGYKLEMNLPDPIVLQPVEGGYLIVTKWGLEASDEGLLNEKMN